MYDLSSVDKMTLAKSRVNSYAKQQIENKHRTETILFIENLSAGIDEAKTPKMVKNLIDSEINFFDTCIARCDKFIGHSYRDGDLYENWLSEKRKYETHKNIAYTMGYLFFCID